MSVLFPADVLYIKQRRSYSDFAARIDLYDWVTVVVGNRWNRFTLRIANYVCCYKMFGIINSFESQNACYRWDCGQRRYSPIPWFETAYFVFPPSGTGFLHINVGAEVSSPPPEDLISYLALITFSPPVRHSKSMITVSTKYGTIVENNIEMYINYYSVTNTCKRQRKLT